MKRILKKSISILLFLAVYFTSSIALNAVEQYMDAQYLSALYFDFIKMSALLVLSILFGVTLWIWIRHAERIRIVFFEFFVILVILSVIPYAALFMIQNISLASILDQYREWAVAFSGLMAVGILAGNKLRLS